jgi:3-hydroxyisobutyrate dehydrogenase-like beta-hydroxyacid dehydrogenase
MKTIGFIGLGIMGLPMAGHLQKAGYELQVYNRTQSKADDLVAAGAKRALTPAEAAKDADIVIVIVSDSPQVEEVVFGENGAYSTLKDGSLLIDMSTISATATREFSEKLASKGVHMLDAPVSGGDVGAINGTLTIMVGGEQDQFDRAMPLFEVMGSKATLLGKIGSGQVTKSCNQILVVTALMGVCEALLLAEKQGLDLEKAISALTGGAANSYQLDVLGPRIAVADYAPGFMVDLVVKDLHIVQEVAKTSGLSLESTDMVTRYFEKLKETGSGGLGTQALMEACRERQA